MFTYLCKLNFRILSTRRNSPNIDFTEGIDVVKVTFDKDIIRDYHN